MLALVALVGCPKEPTEDHVPHDDVAVTHTGDAHSGASPAGHTGSTADTGTGTAHTGVGYDCSAIPAGPRPFVSTNAITTEEDFDFDATGLLLAQYFYSIKGTDRAGNVQVVASGLSGDAAGIRTGPNGDFVYASPDDGRLVGVQRANGATRTLVSGLRFPNSLEMSTDGVLYAAEFWQNGRIIAYDTLTDATTDLGRMDYPNGMTLSMDEQTLYIASASAYWSGQSTIWAVDKAKDGTFGGVRLVVDAPVLVTSLAVDVCDNLYLISYNDGRVLRFTESTGVFELIADLGVQFGAGFSAIRFSPGIGGFDETFLYATNRSRVYEVEVGVQGRHVLNP